MGVVRPELDRCSGGAMALRAEGAPYAVASLTISSRHFRGQMFRFT